MLIAGVVKNPVKLTLREQARSVPKLGRDGKAIIIGLIRQVALSCFEKTRYRFGVGVERWTRRVFS